MISQHWIIYKVHTNKLGVHILQERNCHGIKSIKSWLSQPLLGQMETIMTNHKFTDRLFFWLWHIWEKSRFRIQQRTTAFDFIYQHPLTVMSHPNYNTQQRWISFPCILHILLSLMPIVSNCRHTHRHSSQPQKKTASFLDLFHSWMFIELQINV